MNDEFEHKIKKMDVTELRAYKQTAESVSRFIHMSGIAIAFITLAYASMFVVFLGFLFLTILGKTSAGIDETIELIKEQIVNKTLSTDK